MRRLLLALAILPALFGSASAQTSMGMTVDTCGSPTTLGTAGRPGPFTVDTNGNLCGSSSTLPSGAATAANQVLEIAALNTIVAQAVPSCTAAPVVSASAEATHVLKNSAGTLCGVYAINQTATPGLLMVFNATSAPGDGSVTPAECVTLSPFGTSAITYGTGFGSSFSTGISVAISSGTNCFTKTTTGMTAFFHGQVL